MSRKPTTYFSARLTSMRERRDFTQAQLGRTSGIDQTQLSAYENGSREPNVSNLRKLAFALDCRADYLLGLTDDTSRIQL